TSARVSSAPRISSPRARMSGGSPRAAGRAGSRPRSSSAGSPPRKRLARRFLQVRARAPVLRERRRAHPRDDPPAGLAVELDGAAELGGLAFALDQLVAGRLGDEEDMSLLRLHGRARV